MTRSITTLGLRALAMAAALACVSPAMAADAESRARAHLTSFPGLTMHGANHSYKLRDTIIAHDGSEHVRFERLFRGMRVIGGDLVVHSDRNGNFNHATHTLRQAINVPARAAITAARADTAALASHAGELRGGATELVVYARADQARAGLERAHRRRAGRRHAEREDRDRRRPVGPRARDLGRHPHGARHGHRQQLLRRCRADRPSPTRRLRDA